MSKDKRGFARKAGDFLGGVDDKVQGFIRDKVYRVPNDGTRMNSEGKDFGKSARSFMAQTFHGARAGAPGNTAYRMEDSNAGKFAVFASRAAQAGGLTAAGVGLANITDAVMKFGGPADQQEPNQIQM